MMREQLKAIREEAIKQIQDSGNLDKLNDVRVAFLGKKGQLTAVLKGMKDVAPEERPVCRSAGKRYPCCRLRKLWRRPKRSCEEKPGRSS